MNSRGNELKILEANEKILMSVSIKLHTALSSSLLMQILAYRMVFLSQGTASKEKKSTLIKVMVF